MPGKFKNTEFVIGKIDLVAVFKQDINGILPVFAVCHAILRSIQSSVFKQRCVMLADIYFCTVFFS